MLEKLVFTRSTGNLFITGEKTVCEHMEEIGKCVT